MYDTNTLPRPVRAIKLTGVPVNTNPSNCYFPINIDQVRELEESLFTRLEMLNLSKKAEDAAKLVFQEQIWQWFSDAQANSTTSYMGCIAPIICRNDPQTHDDKSYPSNRWGWNSEDEYSEATRPGQVAQGNPLVGDGHASDCSTHNEPAMPNGKCDCK